MQQDFIKWDGDHEGVTSGFEVTKCEEPKDTLRLVLAQHILWRIVGRCNCPPWTPL